MIDADRAVPFHLGFWVLERGSAHRPAAYRGIDRLIAPVDPLQNSSQLSGSERLERAARDLHWLLEDAGIIRRDGEIAGNAAHVLEGVGQPVDIIYAVAFWPMPNEHLEARDMADQLAGFWASSMFSSIVVERERFLGFDVSRPFPTFHSLLMQPGEFKDRLESALNAHGLLDETDLAISTALSAGRGRGEHVWPVGIWDANGWPPGLP